MRLRWRGSSMFLSGVNDPPSERRARLVGDRPHRYEEGLPEPGIVGSGDAQARSAQRAPVRVSWPARDLIKCLWHDGQGQCLFSKRLERGRFLWPSPADGVVTISAAQFGYLLSGIDWRASQHTWRPQAAG